MEDAKFFNESLLKKVASYYLEPAKEKVALPRKKIKQKKTIEVEEEETITYPIETHNRAPGVALIIIGVVVLIWLTMQIQVIGFLIGAAIIATGISLVNKVKDTETKTDTITKKVPRVIEEEVLEPQKYEYKNIPNRYKVNRIGVMSLHYSVVRIKDNKVLLFEEGEAQQTFRFPVLKDAIGFVKSFQEHEELLRKIPEILHGEKDHYPAETYSEYGKTVPLRGYEKKLADYLLYVGDALQNKEMRHFNICITNNKHIIQELKQTVINDEHPGAGEINNVLNSDNGEILDEVLNNWQNAVPQNVDYVNDVRLHSLDGKLSTEFLKLGQTSKYSSFNFYCPQCNRELVESLINRDYSVQNTESFESVYFSNNTRCRFIPDWNDSQGQVIWECPVCNERTTQPIPLHKTLDETILPVYDKLMEEHKVIRDKKYSETKNKELDIRKEYKSKIDQVKYDNLNQVMALEDEMEKMKAEISGQKEAITYMNQVAKEFRNISSDLLSRIQDDTSIIENRVKERSDQVVASLQLYTENKLQEYSNAMDDLSHAKRIDDERREAIMRNTVNALHEVRQSVEDNTQVTKDTGERVKRAVDENTQTTKRGADEIVKSNRENKEMLRKNFALNAAVYKQQGWDVSKFTR